MNEPHPVDSYGDTRSITRIFFWFIAVTLGALAGGIVIIFTSKDFVRALSIGVSLPLVAVAALFVRAKRFEQAAAFLALVLMALCTVISMQGLGIHSISNIGFAAILIVASMVTRQRTMALLTLFAVACLAWLVFGELGGIYRPQTLERSVAGDFFTAALTIGATAFMVRLLSNALFQSRLRLRRELQERESAESQRETLIGELGAENADRERAERALRERARRLELVASVGRETTTILELEETLARAVALVRGEFGYYNVSIFLARDGIIELCSTAQEEMRLHVHTLRMRIGQDGITGWVAGTGVPLLVPDVSKDGRYNKCDERVSTKSELAVPIRLKGEVIGVLDAQSGELDAFTELDTFTLQTVADQLAVAIENARLYAETRRRAERLAVVNRVAAAVGSTLELDDLLERVHAEIAPSFRADAFFVALYHEESGEMEFRYQVDSGVKAAPERRPLGTGFSSVVINSGTALLIGNLGEENHGAQDLWGSMKAPESWLGVPMRLGDRVTGVISVQAYRPHAYGEEDLTLLLTIADQVAVAVQRARLYESLRADIAQQKKTERLLQGLNSASLAMERVMAPPELLPAVGAELRAIGLDSLVFLLADEPDVMTLDFAGGASGSGVAAGLFPIDAVDIARRVIRSRETLFSEDPSRGLDAESDPWRAALTGTVPAIAAPLVTEETVLGMLIVRAETLTPEDTPAITAFANQIAAARGKTLLVQELERSLRELRQTQEQLLQAQKMEAMGRLAGGIAHDFNNILTAIGGFAALLRDDIPVASPGREYVEEIAKGARRAGELTRQLLAFSRKQVLQPRVIDLNGVVRGMQGILRRIIGEHIELSTLLAPELGRVRADPSQIEQAIMNLAVNARDAMPNGGTIVLATSETRLDNADAGARASVLPPGRYVTLAVRDTGTGMSSEVLSHLYEPFFTTKEQGKGTGLGLSTVYGIVKQSSGLIEVDSVPGGGTRFTILLPRVEEAVSENVKTASGQGDHRGWETILVVEDEPAVLELASRVLRDRGYMVLRANRASEALRICRDTNTPIHLVLTDVVMPGGMSGQDLASELSRTHPGMPVLLMSGYAAEVINGPGTLQAPVNLLEKPFTPEALAQRVRGMLDKANRRGPGAG